MISNLAATRLLRDMDELANKVLYVFMDEQGTEMRSEWLGNDELALRYAELIARGKTVNVLRYVGAAEPFRGR